MVLTKLQKKDLRDQHIINEMIHKQSPRTQRVFNDNLKEARHRLPYWTRPTVKKNPDWIALQHRAYVSYLPEMSDREKRNKDLAMNMLVTRITAYDIVIADWYDPKHRGHDVSKPKNIRFASFPESVKHNDYSIN